MTCGVFATAYERGDRPALIDLCAGLLYGYRRLVTEVTAAASGLIRRGARPGQVVGVHVDTVAAQTLAVHTVIAAGGAAAPLDPALPVARLAERLSDCDARMVITTPRLAESAVRAADESRVRQVIAFGDALGTVDFARLSRLGPAPLPSLDPATRPALLPADGSALTHHDLLRAMGDLDRGVALTDADVLLVTWPPEGSGDLVALVGLAVSRGALVVAAHGLAPANLAGTLHDFGVTVTALAGEGVERPGRERSPNMPTCYPHMP
ncbi:AMP-binding protein [Nonomuraea sp. NPDC049152]|uniref:AMP-binding protein n=1 Tax=Nonomuraea sp. NPDC049152 TaxID=3154350 RepID=UPI0033D72F78